MPTYVEEAREKSSATKEMANSVLVALLIFLAANSSLSLSSSAVEVWIMKVVRFRKRMVEEEDDDDDDESWLTWG